MYRVAAAAAISRALHTQTDILILLFFPRYLPHPPQCLILQVSYYLFFPFKPLNPLPKTQLELTIFSKAWEKGQTLQLAWLVMESIPSLQTCLWLQYYLYVKSYIENILNHEASLNFITMLCQLRVKIHSAPLWSSAWHWGVNELLKEVRCHF